jgi:hypothetical protein
MDRAQRVTRAVEHAKKLVTQGKPWPLAVYLSAQDNQVQPKEVSRAFAARRRSKAVFAPAGAR